MLKLVAKGSTNRDIANELAVRQQTLIATERRTLAELLTTSLID